MPGVPWGPPETAEPRRAREGADHHRVREPADLGSAEGVRGARVDGSRGVDCEPDPARDPRPAALSERRRRRVPDARPKRGHAVRRGRAAHPAGHADRVESHGRAVRPRRTVDRPAPARQPRAAVDARAPARPRQHRRGRRARRRDDPHRGLRDRPRPRRRRARRAGDLPGDAGGSAEGRQRLAHGGLPERGALDRDAEDAASGNARIDCHQGGAREQPEGHRRHHPARRAHHRHGRERFGQVDARQRHPVSRAGAHALPRRRRTRRAQRDRGHRPDRQGHPDRSVTHRPHAALEPGDLHRPLHVRPGAVRDGPGGARAGVPPGTLLVQRQGGALRDLPGGRRHRDRDALPAQRLRDVRAVQGAPLQPRDARDHVSRQVDRRRARPHDRPGAAAARELPADRQQAAHAAGRRPRLPRARPVRDDPQRRRGAAREAREGTVAPRDGPHALHPRRADDRPPLRGHP